MLSRFATFFLLLIVIFAGGAEARSQTQSLAVPTTSQNSLELTLDILLESSSTQFPSILESLARKRAADGDLLAAAGAFDLVFNADGYDRVSGFWTGQVVNTSVSRQIRPLGGQLYGGYRRSDGTFPIYEDVNFTNSGGEFKIGGLFSLLRDRQIDPHRFALRDAALSAEAREFEVLLTRIGVQHRALIAYREWVAAGHQLDVYEDLLRLAMDRQAGLEEQVRKGARAAIFLTENQQNLLRRQRLTADAQRTLDLAANRLSLYYRDLNGNPIIAERAQIPAPFAWNALLDDLEKSDATNLAIDSDVAFALLRERPELNILRLAFERAQLKVRLGENDLKPRLDLRAEVSRDFGAIAEGGPSHDSTDAIVGFRFSVPLERRTARGNLARAQAERDALAHQRRLKGDEIETDLRAILINLTTAGQLAALARDEVTQANTMQRAENIRFQSGASDFFLVNLREEAAADAQIRFYGAALETAIALANFDAATLNLNRLGLDGKWSG